MERALIASSLILTAVLGWSVWEAYQEEWQRYQSTYYRMAALRAGNPAQAEWARGQRSEIKQLEPKERGTVERCVTCHLAFDTPMFEDVAEPLRRHPPIVESHPPQRFGCVVCHGGEGRAVTVLEAHGQRGVLAKPLLKGAYMQAACFNCHRDDTLPPAAIASVLQGRELANRYLCLGCHQVNGTGGEEGPDLSAVGSHRTWLWLYAHLLRPQGMVVGSTMPVYSLPRNHIRDITVYLMTLLDARDRMGIMSLQARRVVTSSEALSLRPRHPLDTVTPTGGEHAGQVEYDGAVLFRGLGCSVCHMIGIRGGEIGPSLTHIAHKRTLEDLQRLLRDPEQVFPGGRMPQLHLNDRKVDALARYLTGLR